MPKFKLSDDKIEFHSPNSDYNFFTPYIELSFSDDYSNFSATSFLSKYNTEKDILKLVTFYQGDSKRDFNPTCYRTEAEYSHLVSSMQVEGPDEGLEFGFDIVMKKKVQTYVEVE